MRKAERFEAKALGKTRYFTGKPCKRGHISERVTCDGKCIECAATDPVRKRSLVAWRKKNSALIVKRVDAWRKANPEKERAWRASRATETVKRVREWRKKNPEKKRAGDHNRRASIRAGGRHTGADIVWLRKIQKGKCAHPWCRADLGKRYHVDHRIALARGGDNDRKNLQLLCKPCNLEKHAKHPIDFAQQHGLLL